MKNKNDITLSDAEFKDLVNQDIKQDIKSPILVGMFQLLTIAADIKKDYPNTSVIRPIQHTKDGLSVILRVKGGSMLIKYLFATNEVQFSQSF